MKSMCRLWVVSVVLSVTACTNSSSQSTPGSGQSNSATNDSSPKDTESPSTSPKAIADRQKFLGKWKERGTKVTYEYQADGKRKMTNPTFDSMDDWAILDDNWLRIQVEDNAPSGKRIV